MRLRLTTNRLIASLTQRASLLLQCSVVLVLVSGCSQEMPAGNDPARSSNDPVMLEQTSWQVQTIDGDTVIEDSDVLLVFEENDEFAGSTGCNRFFGRWSVAGSDATFEASGVTMMACEQALMEQERRFLDSLSKVTSVEERDDGSILMRDAEGGRRLELIPVESAQTADMPDTSQNDPTASVSTFECAEIGRVEIRFTASDTIEVDAADTRYVMTQQRSASGARYVGDGIEFWTRGEEAMLTIGESRHSCLEEPSADLSSIPSS